MTAKSSYELVDELIGAVVADERYDGMGGSADNLEAAKSTLLAAISQPLGYALAMRVLQSDLYSKLDDKERSECDEIIRRGPILNPQEEDKP
jgi:hypothetical protein